MTVYDDVVLADAPVGYWPLNETSGQALDASGNGNDSTQVDNGVTQGLPPFLRRGTTVYDYAPAQATRVLVPDQAAIQNIFDGGGSLECWLALRTRGQSNVGRWITKTGAGAGWRLDFTGIPASVVVRFNADFTGDNALTDTDGRVVGVGNLTTPSHIVVTYNADAVGNVPTIYVNGLARAVTPVTVPTGTRNTDVGQALSFGSDNVGNFRADGRQGNVALYATVLTAAQVRHHYEAGRGVLGPELADTATRHLRQSVVGVEAALGSWLAELEDAPPRRGVQSVERGLAALADYLEGSSPSRGIIAAGRSAARIRGYALRAQASTAEQALLAAALRKVIDHG
jgi:hypothetical protein